ncbi:RimK family alpha-L-glutamate ligase [bacterium]|jgi:gamma-F420-2:alpha-L-glutamate ligase|nr:RimK family alpha-L-glutamate ligase [bacterium]MBT5015479.1 RimK family alpha-L-glutamate ligase [bacterium]
MVVGAAGVGAKEEAVLIVAIVPYQKNSAIISDDNCYQLIQRIRRIRMTGLILYMKAAQELDSSDYVISRFLEAGESLGIKFTVCTPGEITFMTESRQLKLAGQNYPVPSFVIPCLLFDSYYKVAVVRQLESLGTYSLNPIDFMLKARDKLDTQQVLSAHGFPALKTKLVNLDRLARRFIPPIDISSVEQDLGYPVIVKNITGACGYGINLCNDEAELQNLVELIYLNNKQAKILLQEYISASSGSALRVYVLGGAVIGHMKHSSSNSFKSNYKADTKIEPFELTQEVIDMSVKIAKLFNLEMTGIDYLFDTDGMKVCEVNAFPGFKGLEKATGQDIATIVLKHIQQNLSSMKANEKK